MHSDDDLLPTILLTAAALFFLVWMISDCKSESARREEIRRECTHVRNIAGQTMVGTSLSSRSGLVIGGTADQKCYRCQNGIEECF